jgi:chromosome segregation ATPase
VNREQAQAALRKELERIARKDDEKTILLLCERFSCKPGETFSRLEWFLSGYDSLRAELHEENDKSFDAEEEVQRLEGENEKLEEENERLEKENKKLEEEAESLEDDVNRLQNDVERLEKEIEN